MSAATPVKTPCIGICSTTSVGDWVCRGCKRYSTEVIGWISYNEEEKAAVMRRIEQLNTQILAGKFSIDSEDDLKAGLRRLSVPFDPSLSPYCWLHNLLKKAHHRIDSLEKSARDISHEAPPRRPVRRTHANAQLRLHRERTMQCCAYVYVAM